MTTPVTFPCSVANGSDGLTSGFCTEYCKKKPNIRLLCVFTIQRIDLRKNSNNPRK